MQATACVTPPALTSFHGTLEAATTPASAVSGVIPASLTSSGDGLLASTIADEICPTITPGAGVGDPEPMVMEASVDPQAATSSAARARAAAPRIRRRGVSGAGSKGHGARVKPPFTAAVH